MKARRIAFAIFIYVLFLSKSFAITITGFENNETCITVQNNISVDAIIVKRNSTLVVGWLLYEKYWESTIADSYKTKIYANRGKIDILEFCFLNASRNDSGSYIWMDEKDRKHIISLNVLYAANINVLRNKKVQENSYVNIKCSVDSNPLSNISWFEKDKEINTTYSVKNEVILKFQNASCDDTGVYKCSAYNGIGVKDTQEVKLEVLCKPRFVGNMFGHAIEKKTKASIGDKMRFNISMQAYPTPYVIYKNYNINVEFVNESDIIYNVFLGKVISSKYDFRKYSLTIGNDQGNVSIIIYVERRRKEIGNEYIIGILGSLLLLIGFFIIMLGVVKRTKYHKGNLAASAPVNRLDTDTTTSVTYNTDRIKDRKPLPLQKSTDSKTRLNRAGGY